MHLRDEKGGINVRAYSLAMAFGFVLAILVLVQFLALPTSAQGISATIEIKPQVLNLMETGEITAFIWLQEDDVNNIDVSTVRFDGQQFIPALRGNVAGKKLVVKFDASLVASYIWTSRVSHMGTIPPQADYEIPMIITGSLFTGERFESEPYMLKIILPQQP